MNMRLWLSRLGALIAKEFQEIIRDPSSYLVAVILPMIFLLLFGFGITLDAGVLHIAMLNQSGGEKSLSLAADFAHSPSFSSITASHMEEAGRMMSDSKIQGIIVIREDFDQELAAGNAGSVQVIVDGSEPNNAEFIRNYSTGVIRNWQAAEHPGGTDLAPAIELDQRIWYNPTAKSEQFLVPGAITVIMTLIGTLLTSLVFAREYERGTMEALMATPVTRMQMLLGKLIPYFCIGMFSLVLCALAAKTIFAVPFRGSWGALLLVSGIFMLSALGQGLLISVLLKGQLVAAEAGLFTGFLPALILSGFMFDIQSMAAPMRALTKILPATYYNVCIRTIFLTGDDWSIFIPSMLFMALIAAAFLAGVYYKLEKRLR